MINTEPNFFRCPPRRAIQQAKVKKPASAEDLALMALIGTSVSTVIDVIKAMIVEINPEMSVNHVERLLAFYWDYISNVNGMFLGRGFLVYETLKFFEATTQVKGRPPAGKFVL